ncbi:glycosyl transferase [Kaistia sp. 32K]|uniref:glycosyltransferase family 39 protein n=1 Tax=Kaistia sp. 32K TaxID=2795690 RepID=UPI001936C2F6|nr:glycosyltransferase family 39 protein [Kaistia sp. 32K]BCP55953.1 glycosyl transferase [Kaistia sp. 32K]
MSAATDIGTARLPVFHPGRATPDSLRRMAILLIALILVGRLVLAAMVPLVPDEAYYALWGANLSAGYLDHPPMIAVFIRLGTMLVGPGEFGVRLVCVLATVPASVFIWRAADLLITDRRAAPLAAILFNVTLIGFLGMTLATPDAPLVLFAAAMTYFAARLTVDDRPRWWIAMGVATGLAMEAKYSGALFAAGFAAAVLAVPVLRRQLLRPWPWLALLIAILVFAPNLIWNLEHGWATFTKQGGRVTSNWSFAPHYLAELVAAQFGLATPLVFGFGLWGLTRAARSVYRPGGGRAVLLWMLLAPCAYFAFHALRSRVEGNWPAFLFPAFSIAAAAGMIAAMASSRPAIRRLTGFAIPVALVLIALVGIHAALVPVRTLGPRDPIIRMTRGWPDFARDADALRQSIGANYILTDNYQLNAKLARELPAVPVAQFNERQRYVSFAVPSEASLAGVGLVLSVNPDPAAVREHFGTAEPLGEVTRRFDGIDIVPAYAFRIEAPAGAENPSPLTSP